MSSHQVSRLPIKSIAFWAFILNMAWEFLQCTVLFDMWSWGIVKGGLWMWAAIIGDVAIVVAVTYISAGIVGAAHLLPPDKKGGAVMLTVGLAASILLEWLARTLGLWGYSDMMPTLTVVGQTIGLSPVLQITMLPAASVLLATRGGRGLSP